MRWRSRSSGPWRAVVAVARLCRADEALEALLAEGPAHRRPRFPLVSREPSSRCLASIARAASCCARRRAACMSGRSYQSKSSDGRTAPLVERCGLAATQSRRGPWLAARRGAGPAGLGLARRSRWRPAGVPAGCRRCAGVPVMGFLVLCRGGAGRRCGVRASGLSGLSRD
jgi:hypothetical protein